MPSLPRQVEADACSDSDVGGVNEVLVEDPAVVCVCLLKPVARVDRKWIRVAEITEVEQVCETEVLPSATPSALLSSASWADVGKCTRKSNIFQQGASFWAKRRIFYSGRNLSPRIRFDVCDMREWLWAREIHADLPINFVWFLLPSPNCSCFWFWRISVPRDGRQLSECLERSKKKKTHQEVLELRIRKLLFQSMIFIGINLERLYVWIWGFLKLIHAD